MSGDHDKSSLAKSLNSKWMGSLVFIGVPMAVLLIWLAVVQSGILPAPEQNRLPESIEETRVALDQPDFGMFFLDFSDSLPHPHGAPTLENARKHLYEFLGLRDAIMGTTDSISNLVANYSAVARKRVSFGRSWNSVTNQICYDDSVPRTRDETLEIIESMLRENGGFIVSLNSTNLLILTAEELRALGRPVPAEIK